MASKDRILRQKEDTRKNILQAATHIVEDEGWHALNMRRIADVIEYTAPTIYEYFASKEAIVLEVIRGGFLHLVEKLTLARDAHRTAELQLEAMWLAYWKFAFENREVYKAMYGVSMNCCTLSVDCLPEAQMQSDLFKEVIGRLIQAKVLFSNVVATKYYSYWSVVHGLISLNLTSRGATEAFNQQVLKNAIQAITHSVPEVDS